MVLKLETKQIYNQILNKDYILQMCMLFGDLLSINLFAGCKLQNKYI